MRLANTHTPFGTAEPRLAERSAGVPQQRIAGTPGLKIGADCARSRPAKIIKGTKKAVYFLKTRHSPRRLVRRLAPPFFLPAASPCQ